MDKRNKESIIESDAPCHYCVHDGTEHCQKHCGPRFDAFKGRKLQPVTANDFKAALDIVRHQIKTDEGLYIAYHSNISMAFQDTMHHAGYRLPDLHVLANKAAKDFLTNWLRNE
jgi:hypothetical protein